MSRFITLEGNKVVAIRFGKTIVEGEIESELGEIGQIRLPDGTFITPEPEPIEPIPTLEEMQAQTLLNTEYLVCLAEINSL